MSEARPLYPFPLPYGPHPRCITAPRRTELIALRLRQRGRSLPQGWGWLTPRLHRRGLLYYTGNGEALTAMGEVLLRQWEGSRLMRRIREQEGWVEA